MKLYSVLFIIAVFITLNIAVDFVLDSRGMSIVGNFDLNVSNSLAETGALPDNIFYPPGMGIILYFITEVLGLPLKALRIFKSIMLAIGLFFISRTVRIFSPSFYLSMLAVILVILNPYFVWIGLNSRDFATSFGLMTGCIFLLVKAMRGSPRSWTVTMYSVGGILLGIAAILVRITNLFIVAAWLLTLALIYRRHLNQIFLSSIVLVIFIITFITHNYKLTGQATLARGGSAPLFYGNHPAYLHVHPKYDIEALNEAEREFMKNKFSQKKNEIDEAKRNSFEATRSSALKEGALEFISSDPLAFLYRALVKTQWHWFNLEKIPNYTVKAEWDSEKRAIIVKDEIKISYSLAYLVYKIFYLPLFVATLVYLVWRKRWEWIPFIIPYIVLWPIVVITYPQTRYKMIAETLAIIPMLLFSFEVTQEAKARLLKQQQ